MSNWKATAELYESLIDKPKMIEKYLAKPPFKYIYDIITETTKKTGFAQGLYEGDELKADYYGQKSRKTTYLTKIISLVEAMEGKKVQANPQKIVAGMEAELTNELLQAIHTCATSGKSSDPYVKKVLGGQSEEPAAQVKPEKKKIERPPSAAKNKKPESQSTSKKSVEKPPAKEPLQEEPVQQQPVVMAQQKKGGQQYSKQVKQLMEEGQDEVKKEQEQVTEENNNKNNIEMGRLGKKKRKAGDEKLRLINGTGQLNEKQLDLVKGMIQSICQNTAPLGKSIQFINDDIESMNRELQSWRKQYHASKVKMQNELKITEDTLLLNYDKLKEMEDHINDQKGKIQTAKAQIIKNDSIIRDLLMSVVASK